MRYRPFNSEGLSSSAITLLLPEGAANEAQGRRLVYTALECGINSFEIALSDLTAAACLRAAISEVGRGLLVLTGRVGSEVGDAAPLVVESLRASGAGYFNVVSLENPPTGQGLNQWMFRMEAVRAAHLVRMLGLAADGDAADAALKAAHFDVLATSYNIRSGWPERNRIKLAGQRGMTIVGHGSHVDVARAARAEAGEPKGLGRLFHRADQTVAHAYDFLHATPNWSAEQIGLIYALTEPALASVKIAVESGAQLEGLADAVERELPAGLTAQIEIARFTSIPRAGAA